ncbi:transcriptional regulator [Specibacter cremeus]|uniref:transcriptional regulator n=1 Tax=Specibacter cremeus TaxID=1629051 RepID=UPI001F0C7632|nr:transcriptional regulator [Specibacter cremeus]
MHTSLHRHGTDLPRPLIRDSWQRSLRSLPAPDAVVPPFIWDHRDLHDVRRAHPLAPILPVVERLLVVPSLDTGLLVAVGDEHGRLLWVEGDASARRHGESINFIEGTDWSESVVGTSAPGTALVLGGSVQVAGTEHFNPAVHSWSCTAVPVHDPDSGGILGIVDITGGPEAVGDNTMLLVQATVAAAEAQLRIERLERRAAATGRRRTARPPGPVTAPKPLYRDSLQVLGREVGLLHAAGRSLELSERHTEIMAMLALHPGGLSAESLTGMVYPDGTSLTSIRAEMVRLRRLLQKHAPTLVPESRPYRLPRPLLVDAAQVLSHLDRGAHRQALNIYRGEVLPRSEAPEVIVLRNRVGALLREALLTDAGPDALLAYLQLPEAADDDEAWRSALRVLPPRSPRRAAVVAHLEALGA